MDDQQKTVPVQENENERNKRERRKILKNIILISLAFLLNFTGFQGLSRLQSSLHQVQGMGVINQGILYFALIIACLLLPKIMMAKIGHKWTITISILGYILWMAANGYAVWATMVPASVIVGIAAGPLWAAQGSYFTLSAPRYAALTGNTDDATVTTFFGIFFGLFQASGITGSILSSTILVQTPDGNSSMVIDPAICGPQSCPGAGAGNDSGSTPPGPSDDVVWTLLGVYIGIALIGVAIVAFFVDNLPEELRVKEAVTWKESRGMVLATIKHYRHKETLLLILVTMYSGVEGAFYNAEFSQAYVSCSIGIWMVGYVTLPFGIVNACTSFGTGRLAKYIGQLPFFISAFVVDLLIQFTLLFWMPKSEESWVLFVLSGLWGFSDAIWQTHVVALYGLVFPNETEAAFSSRMVSQSVGFVIAFTYSYFLCTAVKIYILMTILITGMIGYLIVEMKRRRGNTSYSTEDKGDHIDLSQYTSTDKTIYNTEGNFNVGYAAQDENSNVL